MKTFVLDANWAKIVSGEMTIEEWKEQAENGPEIEIYDGPLPERDPIMDYADSEEYRERLTNK